MEVGSAFPADAEAFQAVEPREAALDDPAAGSPSGAVEGAWNTAEPAAPWAR